MQYMWEQKDGSRMRVDELVWRAARRMKKYRQTVSDKTVIVFNVVGSGYRLEDKPLHYGGRERAGRGMPWNGA